MEGRHQEPSKGREADYWARRHMRKTTLLGLQLPTSMAERTLRQIEWLEWRHCGEVETPLIPDSRAKTGRTTNPKISTTITTTTTIQTPSPLITRSHPPQWPPKDLCPSVWARNPSTCTPLLSIAPTHTSPARFAATISTIHPPRIPQWLTPTASSIQTRLHAHPPPHALPPADLRQISRPAPPEQARPARLPVARVRHQVHQRPLLRAAAEDAPGRPRPQAAHVTPLVPRPIHQEDDGRDGQAFRVARGSRGLDAVCPLPLPAPRLWHNRGCYTGIGVYLRGVPLSEEWRKPETKSLLRIGCSS